MLTHLLLQLSQSLRVTAYPYTALLAFSGSRIRLIAAAEGALLPSQLLPLLQEAQERQAVNLVAEQADHNEQVLPTTGSDSSHFHQHLSEGFIHECCRYSAIAT